MDLCKQMTDFLLMLSVSERAILMLDLLENRYAVLLCEGFLNHLQVDQGSLTVQKDAKKKKHQNSLNNLVEYIQHSTVNALHCYRHYTALNIEVKKKKKKKLPKRNVIYFRHFLLRTKNSSSSQKNSYWFPASFLYFLHKGVWVRQDINLYVKNS